MTTATLNQILRWNGSTWSQVTAPNPAGAGMGDINELTSVRCANAKDCWAVGFSRISGHGDANQALHWDGQHWTVTSTPDPGGDFMNSFNDLADIACTSAKACWAVGTDGLLVSVTSTEVQRQANEVLRWNGTKWKLVKVPNPAGNGMDDANSLSAIRCAASNDCWAAGTFGFVGPNIRLRNLMLHWNGTKWSNHSVPNPGGTAFTDDNEINALSCTSKSSCWAAGTFGQIKFGPGRVKSLDEVLHFNGRSWSKVGAPNPGGTQTGDFNVLDDVTCSSAARCWAVGETGGSGAMFNSALLWNGKKWKKIGTPDPSVNTNELFGVRCSNADNCFAVGGAFTPGSPAFDEVLQWDGKQWHIA
jgi:hypothetical protein